MGKFNYYFIKTIKNKYADFSGKANRSEYWYFILFYILITTALMLMDAFVINPMLGMTPTEASKGGLLQMFFALAMLIPLIAIAVRRLHDCGKSAWWLLLGFIPIIGSILLIYFLLQKSK